MTAPLFTLAEAAAALQGTQRGAGTVPVMQVNTDSRTPAAGDLFFALRGERFDGHDFVPALLAGPAAGCVVARAFADRMAELPAGKGVIIVEDPLAALGHLAAWWRRRFTLPLVAITGSNGKTTVKDMTATILRQSAGPQAVLATQGNLNNHIGVPLMLLRLNTGHRYAVLEMGMNHFGELHHLSQMAQPTVALVNNAGAAHLAHLGSVAGVAQAKGEIYSGLVEDGIAILNADDAFADDWRNLNAGRRVLAFGLVNADVCAQAIEAGLLSSRFTLVHGADRADVTLPVPGLHNVRNALAATAAALAVGVPLAACAAGLGAYGGTPGRLQAKRAHNGALLIDDTYNANPDSMRAAIQVLAALPAPRLLVLGDMGEVGDDGPAQHRALGEAARQAGIESLWATGTAMQAAVSGFGPQGHWFADHTALAAALQAQVSPECTVLLKGSRFMHMETVVNALQAAPACLEN